MRGVAPGASDDHLVLHDQGRGCNVATALPRIVHAHLPLFGARLLIQRDQKIVGGAEEYFAVAHRYAAILQERHATGLPRPRRWIFVLPQQVAGGGVECENLDARRDQVHDAVDNNRRGLQVLCVVASLEHPHRDEILHIAGVHLIERAVPPRELRAAVMRPIGMCRTVGARSLRTRCRKREQHQQKSHSVP